MLSCVVRVLFIGDVFHKPGLAVMRSYLARHRESFDFIIANGENVAGGRGITRKHFQQMRSWGVDVVTLGNHAWDGTEVLQLLEESGHLVRPINCPPGTPGLGSAAFQTKSGGRIGVAQAMGRIFMEPLDCPFRALDALLERWPEHEPLIVDFHGEATSEKRVMGYHLAGRVAAVIGTHTHVQTADERIWKGTAYITDVGMTGDQNSAIGMRFEEVHHRFVTRLPKRYRPAEGAGVLCGVVFEIGGTRATSIERIQWQCEGGG